MARQISSGLRASSGGGSGLRGGGGGSGVPAVSDPFVVQSASAGINTSRTVSLTFATPPLTDDLVIMWPSAADTAVPTAPSGWVNTLGGSTDVESDAHEICCIYHFVTSGEASGSTVTFTATDLYGSTEIGDVVGCVVRNVDTSTPLAGGGTAQDITNTVTPHILAAVTPTVTGGLILTSVAKDNAGTYSSAPSGMTFLITSNVNHGRALLQYNALSTNGVAVGPTNITPSAGDEYCSITWCLRPK